MDCDLPCSQQDALAAVRSSPRCKSRRPRCCRHARRTATSRLPTPPRSPVAIQAMTGTVVGRQPLEQPALGQHGEPAEHRRARSAAAPPDTPGPAAGTRRRPSALPAAPTTMSRERSMTDSHQGFRIRRPRSPAAASQLIGAIVQFAVRQLPCPRTTTATASGYRSTCASIS